MPAPLNERVVGIEGRATPDGHVWRLLPTLVWDGSGWVPRSMNHEAASWPVGALRDELPLPRFPVGRAVVRRQWRRQRLSDGSELYLPSPQASVITFRVKEITIPGGWFEMGPAALTRAMHEFWLGYGVRYVLERHGYSWTSPESGPEWTMDLSDREEVEDADLIDKGEAK